MPAIAGFLVSISPTRAFIWFAGSPNEVRLQSVAGDERMPVCGVAHLQSPFQRTQEFCTAGELSRLLTQWASEARDSRRHKPLPIRRNRADETLDQSA